MRMDADERKMAKAQCFQCTLISEKKEEELGAVHQQDLSVMEKVIIASESMASNFQIQSIIVQIVKK